MADTLKRIFGPTQLTATTATTLFTGTAGHTYTIVTLTIENTTASAATIKLGIGGVTDALTILSQKTVDAYGSAVFTGKIILTGTETLQAQAGTANALTITGYGLDQS